MSLEKGFLRNPDLKVNPRLIIPGIILSSVISFCFYGFFVFISEALRSILMEFSNSLLLLNVENVRFYGYTFALLASVIGIGFGLRLVLSGIQRSQNYKNRFGLRLNLHTTQLTKWTWLFWVCDWLVLIGFLYISFAVQYHLDIKRELGYIFLLLPLVWFFNYWLHIHRVFKKKKRRKWITGAFLYLLMSTLILGNIRLVDYEFLNQQYSNTFPEYKYNMKLAKSRTIYRGYRAFRSKKAYLIRDKGESKVLFHNLETAPLELTDPLFTLRVEHFLQSYSEFDRYQLQFTITADTRIPASDLIAFEQILSQNGIERVIYRTEIENSKYPWHYPPMQRVGIPKELPQDCSPAQKTLDSLKQVGYIAKQIRWPEFECYQVNYLLRQNRVLVKSDSTGLSLNGKSMSEQEFLNTLTKLVHKYPDNLAVFYQPDLNSSFKHYLKGYDLILQSYITNRKRLANEKYGFDYTYEDSRYIAFRERDLYQKVTGTYYMQILELTGWNLALYNFLNDQE